MTVRMRLSGDPAEIEIAVQLLAVVFQLHGTGRLFPNRGTAGVRVYVTARIPYDREPNPPGPQHAKGRGRR